MVSPVLPVEGMVADVIVTEVEHKVMEGSAVHVVDGSGGLAAVET